nr:MAG TPA: YopX protein [Caudoviricetes sp.]
MRPIKFRGKRLDNGEWEYGDLLQYDDGAVCIGVHSKNYTDDGFNAGQYRHIVPVDENTVGQYTGLKDKKGVMIFEGDLIEHGDEVSQVFFDTENSCFDFKASNDPFAAQFSCVYEIIGNIHDNPELLK